MLSLEPDSAAIDGASETAVSNRVRIAFSENTGGILWRNNNGAAKDERGNFLRYGLANDSKRINDRLKSADLIGIRPIEITLQHVGTTIGQFVSREAKRQGWVYKGTPREKAQLNWATLVNSLGGDARFTTGGHDENP